MSAFVSDDSYLFFAVIGTDQLFLMSTQKWVHETSHQISILNKSKGRLPQA